MIFKNDFTLNGTPFKAGDKVPPLTPPQIEALTSRDVIEQSERTTPAQTEELTSRDVIEQSKKILKPNKKDS